MLVRRDFTADSAADWVRWAVSVVGGVVGALTGVYPIFTGLLVVVFVDLLTGLGAAAIERSVKSRAYSDGLIRKTAILGAYLALCAGQRAAEHAMGVQQLPNLGQILAGALIIGELISIVENLRRMGVQVPEAVTKILRDRGAGGV